MCLLFVVGFLIKITTQWRIISSDWVVDKKYQQQNCIFQWFFFSPSARKHKKNEKLERENFHKQLLFFLIFNLCTIQCHSAMISYSVGSFSSNWLLMNFHSLHFPLLSLLFYYIYFFSFTLRMICGVMAKILYKRNSLTNKLKRTRNWILFNIFYHQKMKMSVLKI